MYDNTIIECRSSASILLALHICKESYNEGLRFYKLSFGPDSKDTKFEGRIYFSFEIDMFYASESWDYNKSIESTSNLMSGTVHLELIRKFAVSYEPMLLSAMLIRPRQIKWFEALNKDYFSYLLLDITTADLPGDPYVHQVVKSMGSGPHIMDVENDSDDYFHGTNAVQKGLVNRSSASTISYRVTRCGLNRVRAGTGIYWHGAWLGIWDRSLHLEAWPWDRVHTLHLCHLAVK